MMIVRKLMKAKCENKVDRQVKSRIWLKGLEVERFHKSLKQDSRRLKLFRLYNSTYVHCVVITPFE